MTIYLSYEKKERVGVVTLNRPHVKNALSCSLMRELESTLAACEEDPALSVIILTGDEKVFSAGIDLKEIFPRNYAQSYLDQTLNFWEKIAAYRKPLIAAVSGYALGGGFELALMCDMIFSSSTARFGQPEVTLGMLPGGGGTQRLLRLIGKARTMELCLTGRLLSAVEAENWGIVNQVLALEDLEKHVLKVAHHMSSFSLPVLMMIKEVILQGQNVSLQEGIRFEKRLFEAAACLPDREEGIQAFLEKRPPQFSR